MECDWDIIVNIPTNTWKTTVKAKAEEMNRKKLREDLFTKSRGEDKQKSKTKSILDQIDDPSFTRKPTEFLNQSVLVGRAIFMGRYGMLECAANFENKYGGKQCRTCNVIDNESHRINSCKVYESTNLCNSPEIMNFDFIYSNETAKCMKVVEKILMMWDLVNRKNAMRDA